jgi:hypothetical protein
MQFNQTNLQTAINQITAQKVVLSGETEGASWLRAIEKAERNLKENHSIYFVDGTLTFKSLESKLTRIVTAAGCVESFCECKNAVSYHKALHAILTRYAELEAEPLVEGQKLVYKVGGIETHYKVENGVKVKTIEKVAGIRTWARGKTNPVTPPPVLADILPFQPKAKPEVSNQLEKAVA